MADVVGCVPVTDIEGLSALIAIWEAVVNWAPEEVGDEESLARM